MTESTTNVPAFSSGELDPIGIVRRRWRLLVFGTVIGVLLSVLYFQTTPRIYQSSIEVLVGQRSSELTHRGTIAGGTAGSEGIGDDQLATHMRLFVARKVLRQAINFGDLDDFDSFRSAKKDGTSPIDHILENIEVERGGEGSAEDAMVLRVLYKAPDPEESALVLSAIYNSYKSYVDSQDQDNSKLAVELIDAARETHEVELRDADQAYRSYVSSVPVLLDGDKVQDVHKERLAKMENELNDVRASLAESTARLQVIQAALRRQRGSDDDMGHLALLSQKEVERLQFFVNMARGGSQSEAFQAAQPVRAEVAKAQYNRLLDLIQKEKALSDTFGAGHPLVEAARQETMITRQFIEANSPKNDVREQRDLRPAEMVATYVMLLQNDIAEFEKREAVLVEESNKELQLAKKIEADFLRAGSLQAKLQRAQARYDQVIERLQELNLSRSYAGFSTDLLASAEVPLNPVWPNLPIVLALGLAVGLAFGSGLALAAETFDSTFSSVEDLENSVGAAVIAHVPRMPVRKLIRATQKGSRLDPSLMTYHSPRSPESEIFRVGRTSMMIANRKDSVQTVMVTSPQPGDGKSTTISNLAISLAQTGKRVLLIDADMRRPVVGKLFGIEQEPGLSDYLLGELPLTQVITASEAPNLDIMPNGSPTAEPAELLESQQLTRLFQEACGLYDMVLVDAPPVLAVADPAIVAPYVDSVLLTVRVTKNGRGIVEDAVRILDDIQIVPTAVIVNGVDKSANRSYQYGGYGQNKYGYVGRYHKDYGTKNVQSQSIEARTPQVSAPPEQAKLVVPTAGHSIEGQRRHGRPAPHVQVSSPQATSGQVSSNRVPGDPQAQSHDVPAQSTIIQGPSPLAPPVAPPVAPAPNTHQSTLER